MPMIPALRGATPVLDNEQFGRWKKLLELRTGIVVPDSRREFLATNLRGRMRETGFQSFDAYYQELNSGARGAVEWATLVDRLTVHQTHFFRHLPSLDHVAEGWLPEVVAQLGWDGSLHAWSVGCATGEEAYTLAMVLDSGLARLGRNGYLGVTGTDVSAVALQAARAGVYPASKLKEIPAPYAQKYCKIRAEQFEIVEPLRKRVAFAVANLLELGKAPFKRLDLIFCQNVLIYFARERRTEFMAQFAQLLRPGGLLMLGPGELTQYEHPELERVAARSLLAFRKRGS